MSDPLDYAVSPAQHRRPLALWAHIRLTIGAFGAWVIICGVLTYVVPRFAQVFQDMRAPLPETTKTVVLLSLFVANGGWRYALIIPTAIVAAGIVIDRLSPTPLSVRLYSILMTLLLMLAVVGFAVWLFAALYAPMVSTLEQF